MQDVDRALESLKGEGPFENAVTEVTEIAPGIFRLCTPVSPEFFPGGFTFAQFLIVDEAPLLFHTGPRRMFPCLVKAMRAVLPIERLRWLSFSHGESDESGALNEILRAAPGCEVICSRIAKSTVVDDCAIRPARVLAHKETLKLGRHEVQWFDTPHFPHGWEAGMMLETTTGTLLCSDLFTQFGDKHPAITEDDILEPSEAIRKKAQFYANPKAARPILEEIAAAKPRLLATMHGPVWRGDGARMLRALAERLER
jgi:flavorubredoxin